MPESDEKTYYRQRKDQYWKQVGILLRSSKKILGKSMAVPADYPLETRQRFERQLDDLPYIGGDQNMLTFTFVLSAFALAHIQVLETYGLDIPTIGEGLVRTYADVYLSLPAPVRWWLRRAEFSAKHRAQLKAFAQFSQRREYPGNWVMEYVEGDHQDFDFGCSYIECAVLKYVQAMDMLKYMPYFCVGDFAVSKALGTGLQRSTSLFCGGNCCDFQYKKQRAAYEALPFENLPEYQNRRRDL
jgi:hypothetical protein